MTLADIGPLDGDGGLRCRLLQELVVVEDESRCLDAAGVLLERAYRRWSGRTDCDRFPPLQRWQAVEPGCLGGAERLPGALIGAAAAGRRAPAAGLPALLQAAVVLHSGCPALVHDTPLPGRGPGLLADSLRHGVLVSIYGLREDDMALAESVLAGCVRLGVLQLVERFSRWLPVRAAHRPVSAPGSAPGADTGGEGFSSPLPVRTVDPIAARDDAVVPVPVVPRRG
ncbi:hypothetical protein AB0L57_01740 [Nocardia sp. NPDC052254]|uniref:hypothetical protein n=1 Tax=Nocardia sp. NPDC052254 TaxID=3155681 RepID=UPI003449497F